MKKKIIMAALALGIAISSFAEQYTLKNLNKHVTLIEESENIFIPSCPIVKDASEVVPMFKNAYREITKQELEAKIKIVSREELTKRAEGIEYLAHPSLCGALSVGDSIYFETQGLIGILNYAGHEIGHQHYNRFGDRHLNPVERLIKEAEGIAFNQEWNEFFYDYIGARMICTYDLEKASPLYAAASDLVIELYKREGNIEGVCERLEKDPLDKLRGLLKDSEAYKIYTGDNMLTRK